MLSHAECERPVTRRTRHWFCNTHRPLGPAFRLPSGCGVYARFRAEVDAPSTRRFRPGRLHGKPLNGDTAMSCKPLAVAILTVLLTFAGVADAQVNGPYKVLKIQLVGGDGGFDYVTADSEGRNLYVARSGPAGHIGVFNLDTLAQVGDMQGVSGHGG